MSVTAALITGAGQSARMGDGEKKEYRCTGGLPVIVKSILAFRRTGLFPVVAVTVPPGHADRVRDLVRPHLPVEEITVIDGGDTRQASVYNGLLALQERDIDEILIHDAARPWVTEELIRRVLEAARRRGAAVPVVEVTDALVEVGPDGVIAGHLSKNVLRGVQTPQGFRFRDIFEAHRQARGAALAFYDDAQVLRHAGQTVYSLPGDPANRKITYAHDLEGL